MEIPLSQIKTFFRQWIS